MLSVHMLQKWDVNGEKAECPEEVEEVVQRIAGKKEWLLKQIVKGVLEKETVVMM